MKTYLSRLVARAQPTSPLSLSPSAHAAPSPADPFENSAAAEPLVPPSTSTLTPSSRPLTPLPSMPHPASAAAEVSPLPVAPSLPAQPPRLTPLQPRSDRVRNTSKHQETVATDQPNQARNPSPAQQVAPLAPPFLPPRENIMRIRSAGTDEPAGEEAPTPLTPLQAVPMPGRFDETRDGAVDLQNAADDFMAKLMPRAQPTPPPPPTTPLAAPVPLRPAIEARAPVPRLQPLASSPDSANPPLPPPSVVIGRLTVEIAAPTPVSAPPSPRSAPRRTPTSRSAPGSSSSARFGLGQM